MYSTFHYFLSVPGCFNSKIEQRKLTKNAPCIISACPDLSLLPFITASPPSSFLRVCLFMGWAYVIFTHDAFDVTIHRSVHGHVQMCSTETSLYRDLHPEYQPSRSFIVDRRTVGILLGSSLVLTHKVLSFHVSPP